MSKSSLILALFIICPSNTTFSQASPSLPIHSEHVQKWTTDLIQSTQPEEIQVAANIVYLLYANAFIDIKIRQLIIPITRLTQIIRTNITNYKTTINELETLKTLTERLSFVIGARTIYNKKLETCINYCNKNISPELEQCILNLELYGQNAINEHAKNNSAEMAQQFEYSAQIINAAIEPLQTIANFHAAVGNGTFTQLIQQAESGDRSNEDIAAMIVIDRIQNSNNIAIQHVEHLLNTLDASTEPVTKILSYGLEICKEHYSALYEYMSSENCEPKYASSLFGMNDLLPDEYKSLLPHPDYIFEHILETIKLYTKIEVIQ